MPYRRLPNTDQARIRALKAVIEKSDSNLYDLAISLKTLTEAKNFLSRFEAAHIYYKNCLSTQICSSAKYQEALKKARLYISHFIQVLNLAVIRSEIKKNLKELYGLPINTSNVPDLLNDSSVLEWGEKIIKGERERLKKGGTPIYNPTIAKVNVHYDIFKDSYEKQKELQAITARSLKAVTAMREEADRIILDIWNQIEKKFEELPIKEKREKCKGYGVIYYCRSYEKNKP